MQVLRTGVALLALMLAMMNIGGGQAVAAQTTGTVEAQATGTIEVHARSCDQAYTGDAWFTGCHDNPAPDTSFEAINLETGNVVSGTTDASGNLLFELAPGTWEISGPLGEPVTETSIYCATTDAGVEQVEYPVTIQGGESVVCDYYFVPEDLSGPTQTDVQVNVNLCIAPGCTELSEAVAPADGVTIQLSDPETGELIGTCTTGEFDPGTCTVPGVTGTSAAVSIDPATVPEGYVAESDLGVYEWSVDNPQISILLNPVEGFAPTEAATPVVTATAAPTVPPRDPVLELPAALYAGTCDDVDEIDTAEDLNDLTILEGDVQGVADALQAASGYTLLPMSVDALLAEEHAVVVFDENDPETVIACGAIGGVLDEDRALSVGLAPVDGSGAAGIAYLAPRGDGSETGISIFLVPEGLVPEATPALETPTPTPIG